MVLCSWRRKEQGKPSEGQSSSPRPFRENQARGRAVHPGLSVHKMVLCLLDFTLNWSY